MQQALLLQPGLYILELLLVVRPLDEDVELSMEQLGRLLAVTPVAVDMDGAGGGRVVDQEDAGDHFLGPDGAGDGVMGNEVLHILPALKNNKLIRST